MLAAWEMALMSALLFIALGWLTHSSLSCSAGIPVGIQAWDVPSNALHAGEYRPACGENSL